MTVASGLPHTQAAVALLRTAGLSVGDASGVGLAAPYVVIYGDLGDLDGPMGDRFADLRQTLVVHAVGTGPEQAQWVADQARATLLAQSVAVDGRRLSYVDHITSAPVSRDDDVSPPLYLAVDVYRVATTPA